MVDKIKKIKFHRMKPSERFVYEIFNNLVEYYHPEYPNNRYYKYNGELLFNHNLSNGYFWCHHNKFWRILEEEAKLNYNQIQDLVISMVEGCLNQKTLPFSGSGTLKYVEKGLIKIEPLIGGTERELEEELIKKEIQPHATNNVETHLELTKQLIKK